MTVADETVYMRIVCELLNVMQIQNEYPGWGKSRFTVVRKENNTLINKY